MKTQLQDNIWIKGFDNRVSIIGETDIPIACVIWTGKTSEIPEELAKECVSFIDNPENNGKDIPFKNYLHSFLGVKTAKKSIQSACNKEYSIIYRTK